MPDVKSEITVETGKVFTVDLPMRMNTSKKKIEALNLNVYRNLFHHGAAHQKAAFHAVVKPLLAHIPKMDMVSLHYDVIANTKRRMDTMNVGSIVDKYFSDTLVEAGIIPDDDYKHVVFVSFGFAGIQKDELVRVTIKEMKIEKVDDMRILLDDEEIQTALNDYVEAQGIPGASSVDISVDEDGNLTAEVMMGDAGKSAKTSKPKRTRRTKAQIAADEKAEKEASDATLETAGTSSTSGDDTGSGPSAEEDADGESPFVESKDEPVKDDTRGTKEPKNPSKESPEESSEGAEAGKTESVPAPVKKKKAGSIFDN